MKKVLYVLAIVLVIGAIAGTFLVTKHYTFAQAYSKGHSVGLKDSQKKIYSKGYDDGWGRAKELFLDDTPLNLTGTTPDPVIITPPAEPSHCTSRTSYGGTTYTDCY